MNRILTAFDIEASSLMNGFPVSIGVARSDGTLYHALVQPTDEWLTPGFEWHPASAQIHGYTIEQLQATGKPPAQIVAELNDLFTDECLATDAPQFDTQWLRELVYAAGGGARFDVLREDLGSIRTAAQDAVGMHGDARKEIAQMRGEMHTHNALSDAASWIAALEATRAWAENGKDLRASIATFEKWKDRVRAHLLSQQMVVKYDGALRELSKR